MPRSRLPHSAIGLAAPSCLHVMLPLASLHLSSFGLVVLHRASSRPPPPSATLLTPPRHTLLATRGRPALTSPFSLTPPSRSVSLCASPSASPHASGLALSWPSSFTPRPAPAPPLSRAFSTSHFHLTSRCRCCVPPPRYCLVTSDLTSVLLASPRHATFAPLASTPSLSPLLALNLPRPLPSAPLESLPTCCPSSPPPTVTPLAPLFSSFSSRPPSPLPAPPFLFSFFPFSHSHT